MKINIGLGIDDNYCQHCVCTMASVLVNSSDKDNYAFYIVSKTLSDENIAKINELKKIRDFDVNFIYIDPNDDRYKNIIKDSKMNQASFNRLYFFTLTNIDKILYLDSDIIVRENIKTLYSTDFEDKYICGAKDIIWKTLKKTYHLSDNSIYINAGVLLINIAETRKIDLCSKIMEFHNMFNTFDYSDQDVINYIFQEKITEFNIRYNYCYPFQHEYDNDYYLSISKYPGIIHYITNDKPWVTGSICYMKSEYFKYLKYTPYYDDFMPKFLIDENVYILSQLNDINKKLYG